MTTGTLMGYPVVSGAVAARQNGFQIDNRFGFAYQFAAGSTGTAGIRMWDLYPNGNELQAKAVGSYPVTQIDAPQTLTYNTQLLIDNSEDGGGDGAHATQEAYYRTNINFYGNLHILPAVAFMCSFQTSTGVDFILTTYVLNSRNLGVYNAPNGANTILLTVDEADVRIGSAADGIGLNAWALGCPLSDGETSSSCGLYKVTATAAIKIGTFGPTDIDPTWTTWAEYFGISVDQVDGNPIIGVLTTTSVTHMAYLVKLDKLTAAVIWACPVGSFISYSAQDMKQNTIKNGTLYYLGDGGLYVINTATGTFTIHSADGITLDALHPAQCSEDINGSLTWWGDWTENTLHPAYIGAYCGTGGHHSGTSMGWRYWPNDPFVAPSFSIPDAGRKRAWNMILDGHSFYILDLGNQGTFAYDVTNSTWSQFITKGYNQWNVANGVMWDQRIVGGDLYSTAVWECQPGAMLDNGALDITHIATGALVKRVRTYTSNAALRLAVSVGQLDTTSGAFVVLSFSDDQGKTWTTMDAISLIEDEYDQEIAWTGLGSFAAPGRIFSITDVGGFLRLDGCDAELDNFDEDGNAQTEDQS